MRSAREAVRWHDVADIEALHHDAVRRVAAASSRAIQARSRFHIVLAGGETPRGVYRMLRSAQTDWTAWSIYFGDERCLPPDDVARNSRMVALAWLDHVTVPADHVHVMAGELGAERAATAYAAGLQGVGDFDLVLLGLGEDGHTASLFPNHDWGARPDAPDVLAVLDAPKPPPERVSLSAARLSRAREVLFLVTGESKRDAVARWRAGEPLPASAIQPAAGVDVLLVT